ncbi:natural killer cells antigen CD94-like [Eublepharis macularius]|uniref:Natural killer cells antigen CD94-like n=1 Tax=Eublepharis macularius TaxID=481883 RepID=A0AA97J4Y0_EUBMA|nr:natural killer cells antigen CD94-like [Eublepharis macularius]
MVLSVVVTLKSCPSCPSCSEGWIGWEGKCYYFSDSEANWSSSKSRCNSHGASLVELNTVKELDFVKRYKDRTDYWIGLRREKKGQPWKQQNGSLFNDLCSSSNLIHAVMCQQCPSALYIGQTSQPLHKRINGHKSDIRNGNVQKPVGEHFNLPGHSIKDLKVAVVQQKPFKNKVQREAAELEFICKFDSVKMGLNRDYEWLSHYHR